MKKKNLLLTALATLGLTAATMAQNVPNYLPTNGLVGWWPFNGNANDESGNGNIGTVNGALLSTDRFNQNNKSYSFGGNQQGIIINQNIFNVGSGNISFSISLWLLSDLNINSTGEVINNRVDAGGTNYNYRFNLNNNSNQPSYRMLSFINPNIAQSNSAPNILVNQVWNHIVLIGDISQNQMRIYRDGLLIATSSNILSPNLSNPTKIGYMSNLDPSFKGKIDDIGIWNRVLTQQEITDLYNAVNCENNTTITPQTNSLTTGSTTTFTASTSDPNPSYVWQSDFGQGYVTLNNFGNYSGTNTATLNLSNIQLANHDQPIRVITTSGNCIDTSNVAIISIADTCINTITDTTLITVTDTLLINTTITGLNPPNNVNTIKVFPNPTNDHITIYYGNFSLMNGYQLKIENSIGQQVFQTNITQQSDYLNLTNWGGNGLYFVHIIDPQGNIIDIRKIVLQ
jgi:hypothetical protein